MAFALDTSTVIAWALREPDPRAASARLLIRSEEAHVPALWWFELRNALVVNERRGRITEVATMRFLRDLARLRLVVDGLPDEAAVMTLARRHRLTVYDAAYLELALRNSASLATLHGALAGAARVEGVALVGD